jgi:hypothetical protein
LLFYLTHPFSSAGYASPLFVSGMVLSTII